MDTTNNIRMTSGYQTEQFDHVRDMPRPIPISPVTSLREVGIICPNGRMDGRKSMTMI